MIIVYFPPRGLEDSGFGGRDELEDPLDAALVAADLGEVTGGGGGIRGANIDIELYTDADQGAAVSLIRRVLTELKAPAGTEIELPDRRSIPLYEG